MFFIHECTWCGRDEERLFNDSWTGMELCLECVGLVANYVTNSPYSEGDNLAEALTTYAIMRKVWDDEDDEPGGFYVDELEGNYR